MGHSCPSWDPLTLQSYACHLRLCPTEAYLLGARSPSGLCRLHLPRAQSVCSQSCVFVTVPQMSFLSSQGGMILLAQGDSWQCLNIQLSHCG